MKKFMVGLVLLLMLSPNLSLAKTKHSKKGSSSKSGHSKKSGKSKGKGSKSSSTESVGTIQNKDIEFDPKDSK